MKIIRLTNNDTGKPIFVNTGNILCFQRYDPYSISGKSYTAIHMAHREYCFYVKETPEQIVELFVQTNC